MENINFIKFIYFNDKKLNKGKLQYCHDIKFIIKIRF